MVQITEERIRQNVEDWITESEDFIELPNIRYEDLEPYIDFAGIKEYMKAFKEENDIDYFVYHKIRESKIPWKEIEYINEIRYNDEF